MGGTNETSKIEGELENALAALISSTRSRVRALPLTDIARWVEVAVHHLGSYTAVADRIGITSKMLRQFSNVRRLVPRVQELFERRELDSVDAATHLAMLSPSEQQPVAKALIAGDFNTIDLRAVVDLRKRGNVGSIASLLRQVADSKTKREYVAEFVVRGSHKREDLMAAFAAYIPPSEIVTLEINGALGRLVLTPKGRRALTNAARKHHAPLKQIIPIILRL